MNKDLACIQGNSRVQSRQQDSQQQDGMSQPYKYHNNYNQSRPGSFGKDVIFFKQRILQGKAINALSNSNTNAPDNSSSTQIGSNSQNGFRKNFDMKPSYFTFKRPLTHSFSQKILKQPGRIGDGHGGGMSGGGFSQSIMNDTQKNWMGTQGVVDEGGSDENEENGQPKVLYSMKQLKQLHHFTNYGQWNTTHSRVPMDTYQKGRFAFKTGGYPNSMPLNMKIDDQVVADKNIREKIEVIDQIDLKETQKGSQNEQPEKLQIEEVKILRTSEILPPSNYRQSINTIAMSSQFQEPIMDVRVIFGKSQELQNSMKKSRTLKRNYLKQTFTTAKKQHNNNHLSNNLLKLKDPNQKEIQNLPLISDFKDLIKSQYRTQTSPAGATQSNNNQRSSSQPAVENTDLLQSQNPNEQSVEGEVNPADSLHQLGSPNVYGKLFIVSNKIKHVEEYQRVLESKNYHQYKILLMKNKIKVMDKYLSQLKPIVCLNSIRSIYKKQSENNEQLTRKRILIKYLERLFDQKMHDHFRGLNQKDDKIITEEVRREIIMALAENILSGQLDSEDGNTERQIDEILNRYGLKRPPQRLFD
ncbi:UNKNOWN [Stylonychia lemnae]|uniref:Uncharacterized protein n=1 Tax=Stylonychia lemnae TaxID=5949 RepID=A0A078A320_STYLE|nr:UNKNOWN [Stylonychia lemnae]|eukprot:CDW76222.1 UNKNOWN [Stylonychia lemnae]